MINVEGIKAAGLYLLEVLRSESAVPYSRFYSRDEQAAEDLIRGSSPFLTDADNDYLEELRDEGHVMLEYAAWQLEDLGIVRIDFLDELLIDEEPDFLIELTKKGERILVEGLKFNFRHPDYSIVATPASEWIIDFLISVDGVALELAPLMEVGESDGEVVIKDSSDNDYGFGTGTYAWAFEVSLWHHARCGCIVPKCKSETDEKVWSAFVSQTGRPSRPDINSPHPLWHIPFCLASQVLTGNLKVTHVARVS